LCGIFGSALLIIAGILILAAKHNFENKKANIDDDFMRLNEDAANTDNLDDIWNLVHLHRPIVNKAVKEVCLTPLSATTSMTCWSSTTADWPSALEN
jgi:hypothetical protein